MKHPDEEYWDWRNVKFEEEVTEVAGEVSLILARHGAVVPEREALENIIRDAHIADDPDWSFNGSLLVENIIGGQEAPEALYDELEDLFPLTY